jgi:RNA polymerase sigma-70 factor (ECF subfamily)
MPNIRNHTSFPSFHIENGGALGEQTTRDLDNVKAVFGGCSEAFGEIVSRYQGMVAGIAWRYGIPADDIEDAVSDVMIKVYGKLRSYRPEFAFSSWLYRVAVNDLLDRIRRRRRERRRVALPERLADEAPDALAGLENRERVEILRQALEDISPRHREAIFLVHIEGLKIGDAARILNVADGTIKSRLMRGRQALARILRRRHPELFGG